MVLGANGLRSCASDTHEVRHVVAGCAIITDVAVVRIAMTIDAAGATHRERQVHGSFCCFLPLGYRQWRMLWRLCLVTVRTRHVSMCTLTRKPRHRFVVEFWGPLLGAMAFAAILSELAAVLVILLMTIITGLLAELVDRTNVAREARGRLVLAFERESRMLEILAARCVEFQLDRVALRTVPTKFTFVLVEMAIRTGNGSGAVNPPWMA